MYVLELRNAVDGMLACFLPLPLCVYYFYVAFFAVGVALPFALQFGMREYLLRYYQHALGF